MRKIRGLGLTALIAAWALSSVVASAQSVQQSGSITPRTIPYWLSTGVIGGGITAVDSPATGFSTTADDTPALCVNSARQSAAGRNTLCLSVGTSAAAKITLQNYGTASGQQLQFVINGVTQTFIGASGGVAGDIACFLSAGTVTDCGLAAASGTITSGLWHGSAIDIAYGGTGATTATAARASLGLGTMSTQNAIAVAITGGTITGMPVPSAASDVANKQYVDGVASGLNLLAPSALATAAVLPNSPTYSNGASGVGATLTAGSNTTLTVDGTAAPITTVVLVKNQGTAAQNGIYTVTQAGDGSNPWILTRATYFDQAAEMKAGSYTFITAGATLIGNSYVLQTAVTTVGSDSLTFTLFSTSSAGGVTKIANNTGAFTLTQPITNATNAILLNATIAPQGRVTLASATPVMTANQAAATTIYYTPYTGNLVPIYDGTNVIPTSFTELQIVLGSNWGPGVNYDVFIASDSGTIRACTGPVWSTGTTRGTGAGSTDLERAAPGFPMNKNSMTCRYNNSTTFTVAADRGTYVGTVHTGAAGQVNYIFGAVGASGTAADFGVWNMYGRVAVTTFVGDNTPSWTYATANTWHAVHGSTTMRVSAIRGFDEDGITAQYIGYATPGAGANVATGIGLNSTSGFTGSTSFVNSGAVGNMPASYAGLMGLGYVFVSAIEYNSNSASTTWYGNLFAYFQTGMTATLVQ